MNEASLFVIGAAKSGTTAVFNFLRQHPRIFLAKEKETNFFTYEGVDYQDFRYWGAKPIYLEKKARSVRSYESYYREAPADSIKGEASVSYLYHPYVAQKIAAYNPQARLIAILRNPVERAYSHYLHMKRLAREELEFGEALQHEAERMRDRWVWDYHYANMSLYFRQLQVYWKLFPPEQMRIFLYDDFTQAPARVMQEIFEFLGLDASVPINVNLRFNVSGAPRSSFVHRLVYDDNLPKRMLKAILPLRWGIYLRGKVEKTTVNTPEPMPERPRHELLAFLREDIGQLQDALGRDLSHWLV